MCFYLVLDYTERERASIPRAAVLHSQQQIRLTTTCQEDKRKSNLQKEYAPHPNQQPTNAQKTFTPKPFEHVEHVGLLQPLPLMSVFILTCLQRGQTVCVLAVSSPAPLRYFSISEGGQTTVWSSSLHALRSLGLSACCSPSVDGQDKQTSMKSIF